MLPPVPFPLLAIGAPRRALRAVEIRWAPAATRLSRRCSTRGRKIPGLRKLKQLPSSVIEFPISGCRCTRYPLYRIPDLRNYSSLSSALRSRSSFFPASLGEEKNRRERERESRYRWKSRHVSREQTEGGVFGTVLTPLLFSAISGEKERVREKDTVDRKTVKRPRHGVIKVKWIPAFFLPFRPPLRARAKVPRFTFQIVLKLPHRPSNPCTPPRFSNSAGLL